MTSISDAAELGRSRLVGAARQSDAVLDIAWVPAYLDTRPIPVIRVRHEIARPVSYYPSRRPARPSRARTPAPVGVRMLVSVLLVVLLACVGGLTVLREHPKWLSALRNTVSSATNVSSATRPRVAAAFAAPESGRTCFVVVDSGHLPCANELIFDRRHGRPSVLVGREVSELFLVARRDDLVTDRQSDVDPRPWQRLDHGLCADPVDRYHRRSEGAQDDQRARARYRLHVLTGFLANPLRAAAQRRCPQ